MPRVKGLTTGLRSGRPAARGLYSRVSGMRVAPSLNSLVRKVKLLMHNEPDVRDINAGVTFTNLGGVAVSTAAKKFGSSSLAFTGGAGSGSGLIASGPFSFGTGDFTVEWFGLITNIGGGFVTIIGDNSIYTDAANWLMTIGPDGSIQIFHGNSQLINISSVGVVNWGVFTHHAITRSGNTLRYFVDGAVVASATLSPSDVFGQGAILLGQQVGFGREMAGYMDELRVTVGVARYTANFTVPTKAFSNK